MIRNLKALGLALAAVFAMSAVVASGAQATAAHIRCGDGTGTCKIKLETHPQAVKQIFTTSTGAVECSAFNAEYSGAATVTGSATLTGVAYTNCKFGGLAGTTVEFVNCDYELGAPETIKAGHATGEVTIGPAGCEVDIKVTKPVQCTIKVTGLQNFPGSITYTNVQTAGQKEEITGHAEATGIKYHAEGVCEGGAAVTKEDGKYVGTFTAKGYDTSTPTPNQVDLTTVDTP